MGTDCTESCKSNLLQYDHDHNGPFLRWKGLTLKLLVYDKYFYVNIFSDFFAVNFLVLCIQIRLNQYAN
jgi:hypothetical protein